MMTCCLANFWVKVRAPEPSGTLGVRSLSGAQAAALMNCCDSWVRTILMMVLGMGIWD